MAINRFALNVIAKAVSNRANSSLRHTFWKTNFNMPVVGIYSNLSDWLRFVGPFNYTDGIGTNSYNLSGFNAGYEVVLGTSIWDFETTTGSSEFLSATLRSAWRDGSNNTIFSGANVGIGFTLPGFSWWEYAYSTHIGVDNDEMDSSGTYKHVTWATGTHSIPETPFNITISNCPNPSGLSLSTSKQGFIWVEGENLCYCDGGSTSSPLGSWKQTMTAFAVGSTSSSNAGYFWVDSSTNKLSWVGATGLVYRAQWAVQQFASSFSNSSTGSVNAGTSKAGYIWIDTQFGGTHLGYIGNNGMKWLTGSGDNPYV